MKKKGYMFFKNKIIKAYRDTSQEYMTFVAIKIILYKNKIN